MKNIIKLLALVVLVSAAGCYHNPRTAWTPPAYKKKQYRPAVK
ncbi:MAG: hypothetical protein ACOVQA_11355 [Thermoflexibacteraceae bacterium]